MNSVLRVLGAFIISAIILSGTGCVTQPVSTNNTGTINAPTNSNANANTPAALKTSAPEANPQPVTLPLLDAFFHDDTFAPALKTQLQLTDEQIEKLRTTARDETSKLRETDAANYNGSTAAARSRAAEQIKAIIGEEKARQLETFISDKWSSDGTTDSAENNSRNQSNPNGSNAAHATKGQPNAVPTDSRIVVNTPAYRMDVFEGGRLVKSYKIGIGYPEFPLPTGQRKAASIIFNPTWTPPDEPWVETAKNIKAGQKIDAGSKLNPLGPIKIPIGLPSLIHGGKAPAKLGGFASHGCVGLTSVQVQEFAGLLARLGNTSLTDEQIAAYAKTPTETKEVKLSHSVPVELRYDTIVVENGRLHIYRDVYDRDTNTEENLRAVLGTYGVTLEQLSDAERTEIQQALKEMSRDARGKLDEAQTNANANTTTARGADEKAAGKRKETTTKANNQSGQVTRTVVGKKEIVIEIAALAGKGYPAPVDLSTGGPSKKQAVAPTATADKRRAR